MGKKSPKTTPKGKSPAGAGVEPMEAVVKSSEKKSPVKASAKVITPLASQTNGSVKKSETKQKGIKRKLDDDDYEETTEVAEISDSESDLPVSQNETGSSGKKQKKKKQKRDSEGEKTSSTDAKATLTSDDEKEDEAAANIPAECRLFVTGLGLEDVTKEDLAEFFKSHGYDAKFVYKRKWSRHALLSFGTETEAKDAKTKLDKTKYKGFPLSIEAKDRLLLSLRLMRSKPTPPPSSRGSPDCMLYVSPVAPGISKPMLSAAFPGVVHVFHRRARNGKKNWVRVLCSTADVAKALYKTHQGTVVEGHALRLETPEEFQKRVREEDAEKNRKFAEENKAANPKKSKSEKKQENKLKQTKEEKPAAEESAEEESGDSDSDDDEDVKAASDNDSDSDSEEEKPPQAKKTKFAGKNTKFAGRNTKFQGKKPKFAGKR